MKAFKNGRVEKLEKQYVGDDCVQIMVPFIDNLSIIDEANNKTLFCHRKNGSYVNLYVKDERRHQFPYSNIPMHFGIYKLEKCIYVNQLLEFNKLYSINRQTEVVWYDMEYHTERYKEYLKVIKHGEEALLIRDTSVSALFDMTADELKLIAVSGKEPKISRILNSSLKKEEILEGKRLVKERRKK